MKKIIFINNNKTTLIDRIKDINEKSSIKEINCYVGYASIFGIWSIMDIFKEAKKEVKLNFYFSEYASKKIDINNNFNSIETGEILDSIGYLIYKKIYDYFFAKNKNNNIKFNLAKIIIKKYKHNHILKDFMYHGKVYEIITENNEKTLIIGSSNLTCNGLSVLDFNSGKIFPNEVNIETNDTKILDDYKKWLNEFNEYFRFQNINSIINQQVINLHDFIQYCFDIKQTPENLDKNVKLSHFKNVSEIWKDLKDYQKKTFLNIFRSLENYGGSVLNYDVGLGKTHIGLAIFEYYLRFTGNKVYILVPKRLKSQWEEKLTQYKLSKHKHLIISNSDNEQIKSIKDADLLIIDEAHWYRNKDTKRRKLLVENFFTNVKDLDDIDNGEYKDDKKVLLITATPYNNSLDDLVNLLDLFGKPSSKIFHDELNGIFENYSEVIKKPLDNNNKIKDDFIKLISYCFNRLNKRQKRYTGNETKEYWFPKINTLGTEDVNKVVIDDKEFLSTIKNADINYINSKIHKVLNKIKYIESEKLFSLNAEQLVSNNLKIALDSSFQAFRDTILKTCEKILNNLNEFKKDEENYTKEHEKRKNKNLIDIESENDEYGDDSENFEGIFYHTPKFLKTFDINKFNKLNKIKLWVSEFELYDKNFNNGVDIKFSYLIYMLNKIYNENIENKKRKSIIFAQRINTIEYIYEQIKSKKYLHDKEVSIFVTGKVIKILSGDNKIDIELNSSDLNHINFVKKYFSPISNEKLFTNYKCDELNNYTPKLLFTTNILSEGHDLQDATILINYDNHYNPTIIIQRIGRVDRFRDYKRNDCEFSYKDNIYKSVYIYSFWLNEKLSHDIRMWSALKKKSKESDLLGSDTYKYYIEYNNANKYEISQDEFSTNLHDSFTNTNEIFDALKAREYQDNHWNTLEKYEENVISKSEDFICFPSKNNGILFLVKLDGQIYNIYVNHKLQVFLEDNDNEFFKLINDNNVKSIDYDECFEIKCDFSNYLSFLNEIKSKRVLSKKMIESNNYKKSLEIKKIVYLINE